MKFNNIKIDVFILLLIKLLCVARIRAGEYDRKKDDATRLCSMLSKIKTDRDFFTREVFMDDGEKGSISKYYDVSFNGDNVYKIFHVLNIALSCEYSEIAYHYIKLFDVKIDKCLSAVQEKSLPFLKENLLISCLGPYSTEKIMEHTKIMVLSLAYLMRFAKNTIFKYHDVLKYLLLWYTFTYHNYRTEKTKLKKKKKGYQYNQYNQYNENEISRIKSMKLTNYQIKSSLERFIVKHCRDLEDFESFSDQVDDKINGDEEVLFKNKEDKLNLLAIPDDDYYKNNSVINNSDAELSELITLLNSQVPGGSIQIPMKTTKTTDKEELSDILEVFDKRIKDSIDLHEILLYNRTLIKVVYQVIVRHEIKAVNEIMENNSISNKEGECLELLKKLNNYIDGFIYFYIQYYRESIVLRQKLLENRMLIADVCRFMKDTGKREQINKIVETWKSETNWVHEIKSDAEFGSFLKSLSKRSIAAKFHPAVLNAFWEKTQVAYIGEHIWVYGWDLKLYTTYNNPVDNVLCDKISETMELLTSIESDLRNSLEYNYDKEQIFSNVHNTLNKAIINIANITMHVPPRYSLDWKRILLTLLQNNTRMFDAQVQKTFNEVYVKRLRRFLYALRNQLTEKSFVVCSCGASSHPNAVGKCADSADGDWTENVKNIDEIAVVPNLIDYRGQFQTIIGLIEKLNTKFESKMKIMIYWDGNEKHLIDVYNSYKDQAFDIQDAQDYANYLFKWAIAIPYTRLYLLVHGIISDNFEGVTSKEIEGIKTSVNNFLDKVRLANSSVRFYFDHLISSLESFIDGNRNDLQTISHEPYDEIGIINVVAIPELTGNYSERISEFLSEIGELETLLTLSEDEDKIMRYSK